MGAEAAAKAMEEIGQKSAMDLTDDDLDTIADIARKEISGEVKEPKEEEKRAEADKKEDEEKSEEEKQKEAEEQRVKEEEKAKAKAEKQRKEDDRILAAKDEELEEEEKTRKVELVKIREEEEKKKEEEYIKTFAEKRKLTPEKAKEEITHLRAVKEKYKADPDELAYAYLNAQRAMTKAQEDLKAEREYKPVRGVERMSDEEIIERHIDSGKYKINGVSATREQIIDQFREAHPNQTEGVEDDKVVYMIANSIRQHLVLKAKESVSDMKVRAKDTRDKVIADLSEKDKAYSEEIREVLNHMSDQAILSDGFSSQDLLLWAKGKKVEELEGSLESEKKKSYDEGYKKGQEAAKILGTKTEGTKGGGNPQQKTVTLTEEQKNEALNMFQVDSMTEDEKFAAYKDILESRKKSKGDKTK